MKTTDADKLRAQFLKKERRLNEMIDDAHSIIVTLNREIYDLKRLIPTKKLHEHYRNKYSNNG